MRARDLSASTGYSPLDLARYLAVVAAELNRHVAPELGDGEGRRMLATCVRVLARLSAGLDCPPVPADVGVLTAPDWVEGADNRASVMTMLFAEAERLSAADERVDAARQTDSACGRGLPGSDWIESERIDRNALEAFLLRRYAGQGDVRVTQFRQVAGGRSKQTALVTVEGVSDAPEHLAIRRDSLAPVNQSVEIEFPVVQALFAAGLKVAEPCFLVTDPTVLGASFMVSRQVPGKVVYDYWDVPPSRDLALALAEQLGRLHAMPVDALAPGLARSFDQDADRAWLRDLDHQQAEIARNYPGSATMAAAIGIMRAIEPALSVHACLVHSDAIFHNVMIEGNEFVALLDWETAHIGHPGEDIGYCRAIVEQVLPLDEFMHRYQEAGGTDLTRREVDYFSLRQVIYTANLLCHARRRFCLGEFSSAAMAEVSTDFIARMESRIAQTLKFILASY